MELPVPVSKLESPALRVTEDHDGLSLTRTPRRERLYWRVPVGPALATLAVALAAFGQLAPWLVVPLVALGAGALAGVAGWRPPRWLDRPWAGIVGVLAVVAVPAALILSATWGLLATLAAVAWWDLLGSAGARSRTRQLTISTTAVVMHTGDETVRVPLDDIVGFTYLGGPIRVRTRHAEYDIYGLFDPRQANIVHQLLRRAMHERRARSRRPRESADAVRALLSTGANRGR